MELNYEGCTVVVTGGAGALGRAVVKRLLDAGARCIVPAWESSFPEPPFGEDSRVTVYTGKDLTDEATVVDVYAQAASETSIWGSIHVAGGFAMAPLLETSADMFERQHKMNALSVFLCSREAVRRMGDCGGRIVNVAARPALHPTPGMVAYSASKAAVVNMTQSLALEVAERGIWVNAIVPSIMDTPNNRAAMPNADHSAWPSTDDVARTIAFLASPQNAVTHGALVPVYGKS